MICKITLTTKRNKRKLPRMEIAVTTCDVMNLERRDTKPISNARSVTKPMACPRETMDLLGRRHAGGSVVLLRSFVYSVEGWRVKVCGHNLMIHIEECLVVQEQ